jgi:hypothetical protein
VTITVGGQLGSASNMFSYSPPEFFAKSSPPHTPGSRVTVIGKNFGALSSPTRVRIGSSSCSSPVMVLPHEAFSCLLPVPNSNETDYQLSIDIGGNELTYSDNRIVYSFPNIQRSRGHSQLAASGSSFITLIGNLFGERSSSPTTRVGSTLASGSIWLSSSSVKGKVSSGFGCSLSGFVSFYRGASGNVSMAFSYRPQIVAASTGAAYATTGSSSITIAGSGLGARRSPGSVSSKLGSSSCSSSQWASNSHIACKLHPGSGHIFQVVSSAPGDSMCKIVTRTLLYPHTSSYDAPYVSTVQDVNSTLTSTGSSRILLYGASFSTFDASLKARLGHSAAVMTLWNSQSALLCKSPVPRGGASIHVIASIPSQVPQVAAGFHFISGMVRSVLSGQFVSGTNVSLVLDGLVIASVAPDSTGYFVFSNLLDADYVVATYSPGLSPLFATVASSNYPNNYTAAPGPALEQRQSRIVLTWSTFSDDLDAHLLLPDGCRVYVFAFIFLCI